jgi:hypothetical protein
MTWVAMLEGADVAGRRGFRRGKTERCLFKKISILISAEGSTAGCGSPLLDGAAGTIFSGSG